MPETTLEVVLPKELRKDLTPAGWRVAGDVPMRLGETFSLTVTLQNEQRIEISEVVVR